MSETMYVRLKPRNPQQGFFVKRYYYGDIMFNTDHETERPVWYKISNKKLLAELEKLRQVDSDPSSQPLLDIFTEERHKEALKHEENLRLVAMGITTASMVQPVERQAVINAEDKGEGGIAKDEGRAAAVPEPDIQPSTLGEAPIEDEEASEPEEPEPEVASEPEEPEPEKEKPRSRKARRRGRS